MSDISQTNLREPNQTDWANYGKSSYQAPPPVVDDKGNLIVFQGVVGGLEQKPNQYAVDAEGNPYLNFTIDPITLTGAGQYDGVTVRFTDASVKPFEKNGQPQKGNPSKLGNFLKATGSPAKPQSNSEWISAINATKGRKVTFKGDWEARNSETGERIRGYQNFPDDPERPGQKKAILRKGDVYFVKDKNGSVVETKTVESDVLFANLKVRFFVDPTSGK